MQFRHFHSTRRFALLGEASRREKNATDLTDIGAMLMKAARDAALTKVLYQ